MTCTAPLDGYRAKGGRVIVVARGERAPRDALTRIPLSIPCGQCDGCRLEKSRQWAMRCVHEARLSKENSFVTLTYEDKFLPPGGSLSPAALRLFTKRLHMRRLRERGYGIRYYACGEYGDINLRPHYHLLLFNCGFRDRKQIGINKRQERIYQSDELREIWPFGFNTIGDVTFDSAAYVARYVMKKVTGAKAADHYAVVDGDGVVYDRHPEFARMSRMPGIGAEYYKKYGSEVRDHDTIVVNGVEVKPPRYYDRKTEEFFPERHKKLKRKRKLLAVMNRSDNTPCRLRVKAEILRRRLEMKKRGL